LHNEADSFDELSVTQLKGWFAAAESERVLTVRRQESIMFVVCAAFRERRTR